MKYGCNSTPVLLGAIIHIGTPDNATFVKGGNFSIWMLLWGGGFIRKCMVMDFNMVGLTSSFGSAPELFICGLAEVCTLCTL